MGHITGDNPLVSVIIPVYNGERYLAKTIDSVLAQTYQFIEIIVIDDGSTDGSTKIAQSYEAVRYIHQPNQGVPVARNTGIAAAKGEFIAFLDQDDTWDTNKLALQVEYLVKNPELGYVIGKQRLFLERGVEMPSWLREKLLQEDQMGYLPSALLVRASILRQTGGFDSAHQTASDVEWFFKAKDIGIPMAVIPEALVYRRIHSDNQSSQVKALHSEYLKIVRLSVKRQKDTDNSRR